MAFWPAIQSFIFFIAVPLAIKLFKYFGIGFVVYKGLDYGISAAESYVFTHYNAMPMDLYRILTIAGFKTGLSIMFSAMAATLVIKGVAGFRRWKLNNHTFTA